MRKSLRALYYERVVLGSRPGCNLYIMSVLFFQSFFFNILSVTYSLFINLFTKSFRNI